ncbi:hypothetical protein CXG81DRAFT_24007 [Caulochytrium protostelioides]|uniref:Uncharacterized protein n=1 Tax=Caulochytrium protostelioides TaxID=1555241 RepID=A0A4P9XD23_9FUNG|nr:hypothetical protein CXG81DRAFT_24007 [Caulochytrium protostelioides]|eukprot:RKP03352.1 hypothetical protein CXG81DRAFT_24007 [Caulochytrium protostelioides]
MPRPPELRSAAGRDAGVGYGSVGHGDSDGVGDGAGEGDAVSALSVYRRLFLRDVQTARCRTATPGTPPRQHVFDLGPPTGIFRKVRVHGTIVALDGDVLDLDDATDRIRVQLEGPPPPRDGAAAMRMPDRSERTRVGATIEVYGILCRQKHERWIVAECWDVPTDDAAELALPLFTIQMYRDHYFPHGMPWQLASAGGVGAADRTGPLPPLATDAIEPSPSDHGSQYPLLPDDRGYDPDRAADAAADHAATSAATAWGLGKRRRDDADAEAPAARGPARGTESEADRVLDDMDFLDDLDGIDDLFDDAMAQAAGPTASPAAAAARPAAAEAATEPTTPAGRTTAAAAAATPASESLLLDVVFDDLMVSMPSRRDDDWGALPSVVTDACARAAPDADA